MADIFSRNKRSAVMAAIKSKGTGPEKALRRLLRSHRIVGWRSQWVYIEGKPDFVFLNYRIAIFVDGCFWHGCQKCLRNLTPSSNAQFWTNKVERNQRRDKQVNLALRNSNWSVVRFWEHDVRNSPHIVIRRIMQILAR